jgi:hypothetical protein
MVQYARYNFKQASIVAQQTLARKRHILYNYTEKSRNWLCKAGKTDMMETTGKQMPIIEKVLVYFSATPSSPDCKSCLKTLR